ncbi:Rho GTPase-activating protein gacY [Ceratocystis fimbriata CBS 114723]|uniref:Rho GTPase-activating protein gacY n=1 Tax=Ceratocystis fimbriata CBS 114723 TaxID=1035309 RepID=A0A2C5XMC9_9PEZI|nr:Rho GTPase-activating protein gacY [Ceratocystis fimbriata CBS 114723]
MPMPPPSHHNHHFQPSRSEVSLASSADIDASQQNSQNLSQNPHNSSKKPKSKPGFGRMGRSRKNDKEKEEAALPSRSATSTPVQDDRSLSSGNPAPSKNNSYGQSSKDTTSKMPSSSSGPSSRNRSRDRGFAKDDSHHDYGHHKPRHHGLGHKDKDKDKDKSQHHLKGENNGLFSSLKSSGTRAADIFSKGLFGKNARQNSTTEREVPVEDDQYVIKVINLPLVEQTRLTRISKRLEESRDKTEFWMPAFPWRAIDYLNYKGCDVEGLYRVPGSGPQIKKWQRRFDEEHDVDLFEQPDLYDINIVGSMLKAWLRELPDELFPKASQDRISRECAGAQEVPQLLIDELSKLSPFKYYLLFAITCHLSLLLAHADKNKMDYRNLCICFQPCMKIDAFCFKFLVCNWRECWKGCASEAQYIEQEYLQPSPKGDSSFPLHPPADIKVASSVASTSVALSDHDTTEERAVSSSGSSKQSAQSLEPVKIRTKKGTVLAPIDASPGSIRSISTTLTSDNEQDKRGDRDNNVLGTPTCEIRPLSPIKPLSPLGF